MDCTISRVAFLECAVKITQVTAWSHLRAPFEPMGVAIGG